MKNLNFFLLLFQKRTTRVGDSHLAFLQTSLVGFPEKLFQNKGWKAKAKDEISLPCFHNSLLSSPISINVTITYILLAFFSVL